VSLGWVSSCQVSLCWVSRRRLCACSHLSYYHLFISCLSLFTTSVINCLPPLARAGLRSEVSMASNSRNLFQCSLTTIFKENSCYSSNFWVKEKKIRCKVDSKFFKEISKEKKIRFEKIVSFLFQVFERAKKWPALSRFPTFFFRKKKKSFWLFYCWINYRDVSRSSEKSQNHRNLNWKYWCWLGIQKITYEILTIIISLWVPYRRHNTQQKYTQYKWIVRYIQHNNDLPLCTVSLCWVSHFI